MAGEDVGLNLTLEKPADAEVHSSDAADPSTALLTDKYVAMALKRMERAKTEVEAWRKQAHEADRFQTSKQYSDEDRTLLDRYKKPSAVLNTAQKFIRVVSGLERRSREQLEFVPTEADSLSVAQFAELVTKVYDWVMEQSDGHEERSDIFQDKLIRGMGWGETRLDTSTDPDGMIVPERVDGYEMIWDTNARKPNLTDRTWDARVRMIPYEIAVKRWPKKKPVLDMMRGVGGIGTTNPQQVEMLNWAVSMAQITGKSDQGDVLSGQGRKNMIPVVDFEWYDEVEGFYFFDPIEQKNDWLSDDDFNDYQDRLAKLSLPQVEDYAPQLRRVYRRFLFAGYFRLTDPVKLPGLRFVRNCMTGSWDDDDKLWYGFMRLMMDPQRYLNAFWNQALELMRVQAKAGLFAETGAFVNARVAEETYSKTGSITWLKEGGLGKIKDKVLPTMPAASAQMMQIASQMLQEVTGVSPDVLGLSGGDAPGVTMRQRQMANIALLASEFATLRRYRRDEALTIFDFFKFITDGRLIRVGGQFDAQPQVIQLVREPFNLKYGVHIEESDHDPNIRERYRESVLQLAPTLIRTNNFLPELLDYMDLPRKLIEQMKQAMQKNAQQQMQLMQQGIKPGGRGQIITPDERHAKITKLSADTALQLAKAEKLRADKHHGKVGLVLDAVMQQQKMQLERDQANLAAQQGQSTVSPKTVG
ncbi:MAG: hypothetical protein KGJ90_01820 [Patescibacteria group bacterium]|nr:hypothetical protein [Patescibacteria group bacterium]